MSFIRPSKFNPELPETSNMSEQLQNEITGMQQTLLAQQAEIEKLRAENPAINFERFQQILAREMSNPNTIHELEEFLIQRGTCSNGASYFREVIIFFYCLCTCVALFCGFPIIRTFMIAGFLNSFISLFFGRKMGIRFSWTC